MTDSSRFPTSLESDGSDAVHPDPDYSAVYVRLTTDAGCSGHGLAFTLGRGNEVICHCVDSLRFLVLGKQLKVMGIMWVALEVMTIPDCRIFLKTWASGCTE